MTMLQLAGPPAATAFRLEKLRAELRSLAPTVTDVAVHFEHFVNLERPLTDSEQRVLDGAARLRRRRAAAAAPAGDNGSTWCRGSARSHRGLRRPPTSRRSASCRCGASSAAASSSSPCARCSPTPSARRIAPLLHDRMTETLLTERPKQEQCCSRSTSRGPCAPSTCSAAAARALERANADIRSGAIGGRDRLSRGAVRSAEAQPDRRRAHDVRASELGALPAQDLQRRLGHRRRARAEKLVRDDQQHARARAGRRAVRVQGQRRRRRRRGGALVLARCRDGRLRLLAKSPCISS